MDSADEIMITVVETLADEFGVPFEDMNAGKSGQQRTNEVAHHRLDDLGLDESAAFRLVGFFHSLIGREPRAARVKALTTIGEVVELIKSEMDAAMALRNSSALELRIGFDVGLYDRADVTVWVERAILATDPLSDVLLELATLSHRTSTEIAGLLDRLEPGPRTDVFLIHVEAAAKMFSEQRLSALAVLRMLRAKVSFSGTRAEDEVFELHERMDLATQGIYGSVSNVEQEVADYLEQVIRGEFVNRGGT